MTLLNRPAHASLPPRRKAARAAGALLVAVTVLPVATGCGPLRAGQAAVVGDTAISEDSLRDQVDAVIKVNGTATSPREAVTRGTLGALITFELIDKAAKDAGVSVTTKQVDDLRATARQQLPTQAEYDKVIAGQLVSPANAERFLRLVLLTDELGKKYVPGDPQDTAVAAKRAEKLRELEVAAQRTLKVSVNPRYGAWVPGQVFIASSLSGGLASPGTEAQPAGSGDTGVSGG